MNNIDKKMLFDIQRAVSQLVAVVSVSQLVAVSLLVAKAGKLINNFKTAHVNKI